MTGFPNIVWLLLAAITTIGVAQILRALAIRVRNETMTHDLKVNVARLQADHVKQLMIRHGMVAEDPLEETAGEDSPKSEPQPAEAVNEQDNASEAEPEPTRQAA